MKSLKVNYFRIFFQELVRKQECLVEIAARIVPDVENQMFHPLVKQRLGRSIEFFVSGARELGKSDISGGVVYHERRIYTVYGDFSSLNIERNGLASTLYQDLDLCTCLAFHPADHTVLRILHAGDIAVIHFQDAVARLESDFF